MKKEYSNVTKSKQAIKNGLVSLFERGISLDEITIKMLAGAAHVTRGTFYNHYATVNDVATEIEDDFLNHLSALLLATTFKKDQRKEFFTELQTFFETHAGEIKAIAKCIPLQALLDIKGKFNQALRETVIVANPRIAQDQPTLSRIRLFANGFVGSLFDAFLMDSHETIAQVTATGHDLSEIIFPDE